MAILIVEDNPINAKLFQLALEQHKYQTVSARNGTEGLAKLAEHVAIELIITDYMMPEMNGLELIEKIRASPALKDIPILIASAHSDMNIVSKAKSLGCNGFLVKPIDRKQLIERVTHLLKDSPLVLRDKNYMMNKLNMEPAEYDDLASIFAAQLKDIMPNVVLEQEDSEEKVSENLGRLLKELTESATLLGAEKFVRVYQKYTGSTLPTRSQCQAILKSLQELDSALMAYVKPSPKTDALH